MKGIHRQPEYRTGALLGCNPGAPFRFQITAIVIESL
jgi:hypothetical protein